MLLDLTIGGQIYKEPFLEVEAGLILKYLRLEAQLATVLSFRICVASSKMFNKADEAFDLTNSYTISVSI